jgi:hypothetical protein
MNIIVVKPFTLHFDQDRCTWSDGVEEYPGMTLESTESTKFEALSLLPVTYL